MDLTQNCFVDPDNYGLKYQVSISPEAPFAFDSSTGILSRKGEESGTYTVTVEAIDPPITLEPYKHSSL